MQGYVPSNNRTIRIEKLGADPSDNFVDGIQMIFTARNPETKQRVIVGWYGNARVYRHLQASNLTLPHKPDTTAVYNIEASSSNVIRLDDEDGTFEIPSMTTGAPGINAVFYADDKVEFAPILEKIEEFIFA